MFVIAMMRCGFLWYSNTALFCTDLEEIWRFVQKPVTVD